jgi:hypothetical protein
MELVVVKLKLFLSRRHPPENEPIGNQFEKVFEIRFPMRGC